VRRLRLIVGLVMALSVGVRPVPTSATPTGAAPTPAGPSPAAASTPAAAPAPKPHLLTLAGQTPAWLPPDETMRLALTLPSASDRLDVQVVVHRAVTSRGELSQSLDGRALGAVEGRQSLAATDLPTNDAGQRVFTVGVQGPASATALPDPSRIVPGRSGVYPT